MAQTQRPTATADDAGSAPADAVTPEQIVDDDLSARDASTMTLAERIRAGQTTTPYQADADDVLAITVVVTDPATNRVETFLAGEDVPRWARELITNPKAWVNRDTAARRSFDVGRAKVADVVKAVERGDLTAADAIAAEQERDGGPRQTLLRQLAQLAQ